MKINWDRTGRIGFIFAFGMLAGVLIDKAVNPCQPTIIAIDQFNRAWRWDGELWEYWFDRDDCNRDNVGDTVTFKQEGNQ